MIPLPFTRVAFYYGNPIVVPKSADAREMEALRMEVESALGSAYLGAKDALTEKTLWKA